MSISSSVSTVSPRPQDQTSRGGRPPGRPHQAVLPQRYEEPDRPTPCYYDPELWHPTEQFPDPRAVAACWGCFYQPTCAARALDADEEFGIWAGYRLAPGPELKNSRKQLAIIAGRDMGPAASPGAETDAVLAAQAAASNQPKKAADGTVDAAPDQHHDVISLTGRQCLGPQSARPVQLMLELDPVAAALAG